LSYSLIGVYDPIYDKKMWNFSIKMPKNMKQKLACTSKHFMFIPKFSAKKTFYVPYIKKRQKYVSYMLEHQFFLFVHGTQKNIIFS
jgi:hypothetical protein